MKFNLIHNTQQDESPVEITELESVFGVELVITERANPAHPRYYVEFQNSGTTDGYFLAGTYGNGSTIDEAISDYANQIQHKTLVIDAWTANRKEFKVPMLKHTKLLNK